MKKKKAKEKNYMLKPVSVIDAIMLASGLLAFLDLILFLVVIITSKYDRFFFDMRFITYLFFGLIVLMFITLVGVVFTHILSKDAMPTYDEFKRAQNRIAFMKKKSRFPELLDFDANNPDFTKVKTESGLTLHSFCDDFRDYVADQKNLYYTIDDIRRFVTNLATSKTMILQGMSGTGKTSIANAFGDFIGVPSTIVPVQPMWKEKSDLLGYYNEFTGKFNETTILKVLYEANFSDKMFIVVLDEMNIARVEYYFSEFLSLLELPPNSERLLVVASSEALGDPKKMSHGKIVLPKNVWFLGTANNDDSTFAISDKVYDRAMVMNLNNRAAPFKSGRSTHKCNISCDYFDDLVEKARKEHPISEEALKKLKGLDEYLIDTFHITFGNRIMMQIRNYVPVYIACGGTEDEALDDLIYKKIIRKLEAVNPVYVKLHSKELIAKFDSLFGQDVLKESIAYINHLSML